MTNGGATPRWDGRMRPLCPPSPMLTRHTAGATPTLPSQPVSAHAQDRPLAPDATASHQFVPIPIRLPRNTHSTLPHRIVHAQNRPPAPEANAPHQRVPLAHPTAGSDHEAQGELGGGLWGCTADDRIGS